MISVCTLEVAFSRLGTMFGTVEDYGEMFQDGIFQTRNESLSSTNQIGNPVAYKLVRVCS